MFDSLNKFKYYKDIMDLFGELQSVAMEVSQLPEDKIDQLEFGNVLMNNCFWKKKEKEHSSQCLKPMKEEKRQIDQFDFV